MGKSQKKRQMRRHNPMRVPDSHLPKGLAGATASSSKNEQILPILQKMESPDASDRKWACVAVSNLIQNDPSTRRLLQGKNVVGALITRLTDSEEEVVVEAAGALRNLCIDGGYDICGEMYNKGILSPLKSFIPKISTTLSQYLENPKTAPENAQKLVYEFADNVITILWCLSETSNKALNAINQISLIPFLMSFLGSRDKLPISTVSSAAQCLYVLTDDNYVAINEVRTNAEYTACLLGIVQPEPSLPNGKGKDTSDDRAAALRVLCCGILRNITPIPPPSIAATVDIDKDIVLPVLEPILSSVSLPEIAQRALELAEQENDIPTIEKLSLKHTPKSDHRSPAEIELQRLETKLRTVQSALEILTGVCATLPEPEAVPEGEEDAEDEAMEDQDEDLDMAVEDDAAQPSKISPVSTSLPSLVAPLLALIHPTPLSFPPITGGLSPHPPTTSALSAVHVCALECLNNIFLSLATPSRAHQNPNIVASSDTASGVKIWDEIWKALGAVGTDFNAPGQERRKEMWYLGVGALWGVGIVWKGSLVPNEEQVQLLIQLCNSATDDAVKVKCLGTLECLAQHPQSIEANKIISTYFLSLLPATSQASTTIEPLLQTLSALIDIYSDESLPYDINFRQGKYTDVLAGNIEHVRKAVRGIDRKRERELKRRGEEVRDNLVAFVQYRRGLRL
ncbi:Armadillo-like helical [Abortiporus biennis]